MKRKILVAGAGHGGLVCAVLLSRKGFDVTVIERKSREELGYEWMDCMPYNTFKKICIEPPPSKFFSPYNTISYFCPSKKVLVESPKRKSNSNLVYIERKDLIEYLISLAEKSGAKLIFGEEVTSLIYSEDFVTGVKTEKCSYEASLVIDSSGVYSPLRKSLPEKAHIIAEIKDKETLFAYRGMYENNHAVSFMPKYNAYFYHNGNKGFDWVINEDEFADVLVGSFGSVNESIIKNALDDFRKDHPYLSEKLIRGGCVNAIPLRRCLPLFVYNGYALVGDSAFMTEPLSGSGIGLSMLAGGILSNTVMNCKDFSKESLWAYNRDYLKAKMNETLNSDFLKSMMMSMGEKNINAMFEKKVITYKELSGTGKQTPLDILNKIFGVITTPKVVPLLIKLGLRLKGLKDIIKSLPDEYTAETVRWAERYEKL